MKKENKMSETIKAIKCELCGSNELVKQEDYFVCQFCGTKYTPEAAKKLLVEVDNPVSVKGINDVDEDIKNVESLTIIGKFKEAENILNKLERTSSNNPVVWFACAKYCYTVYTSEQQYLNYQKLFSYDYPRKSCRCNPLLSGSIRRYEKCISDIKKHLNYIQQISKRFNYDVEHLIEEINLMVNNVNNLIDTYNKASLEFSQHIIDLCYNKECAYTYYNYGFVLNDENGKFSYSNGELTSISSDGGQIYANNNQHAVIPESLKVYDDVAPYLSAFIDECKYSVEIIRKYNNGSNRLFSNTPENNRNIKRIIRYFCDSNICDEINEKCGKYYSIECINGKTIVIGYEGMYESQHYLSFPTKLKIEGNLEEHMRAITNGESGEGGCYIATCVYGSYDCPEVWRLRRFRDSQLSKTWYGRTFIKTYYAISPALVKWFGETAWFKKAWKAVIDRIVMKLKDKGFKDTPYKDKQ